MGCFINTVALCMIIKNEILNIGDLIEDVCPVLEQVHLTDTGSTDGTLDVIKEKQKKYPNLHLHNFTWTHNFAEARNYSLSHAKNVDWIFWLDGDDRIDTEGLRKFKDTSLSNPSVSGWLLPYIYTRHADGTPQLKLHRERFLRACNNPRWVGAIHEYMIADNDHNRCVYDDLAVVHTRNESGKQIEDRRNLKILKREFERDNTEPRIAYYYGKELADYGEPQAKEILTHYLDLNVGRYWDDEIGARFRLANIYLRERNLDMAMKTAEPIYRLDGTRRRSEYYYIFGEVEYICGNLEIAIDWYKRCLYDPPGSPRVMHLAYWGEIPINKMILCYRDLGRWDDVFEWQQKLENKYFAKELESYVLHPKDGQKTVTLEFGTEGIRSDGYVVNKEPYHVNVGKYVKFKPEHWKIGKKTPFLENSIDGCILEEGEISIDDIYRILKPGGFLLTAHKLTLNKFKFKGRESDYFKYEKG